MTRALRQNHGVVTGGQLLKLGFSSREVRGLVAHGELRRLHRGVYADGRAPLSDTAYLSAALLALGPRDAWLSGPAAATGWSLERLTIPRLEVTVVAAATPRPRPNLRVRSVRHPPHPSEVRTVNGLRLSSIPRLLVETAAAGSGEQSLHRLLERALRRGLLDVHDLAATLQRNQRTRGVLLAHQACERYLPHTNRKSGLERAFDRWLAIHPEIPPPLRNIRLGPWEIDCYWPESRLALELDGRPYHTLIAEVERDHRKDTWLQARRHHILRVTDARFRHDKRGVHQDLCSLLALGLSLHRAA